MEWLLLANIALSGLGSVLSCWAVFRAYVPPQQRTVNQLRSRVEELELDQDDMHERLNSRSSKQNMAKAREKAAEKHERREKIEEEAARILTEHAKPAAAAPDFMSMTRAQLKAWRDAQGKPS